MRKHVHGFHRDEFSNSACIYQVNMPCAVYICLRKDSGLSESEWNKIKNNLRPKMMMCAKDWSWCGFSDYFLGRFVVCISGSCFVAAIPFQNFSDDVAKSGMSITECAHKLKDMKADQLIADGGCYHCLRPGEGAVIPPGFMLFKCHPSCVADDCWALDEPAPPASEGLVMLASRESAWWYTFSG